MDDAKVELDYGIDDVRGTSDNNSHQELTFALDEEHAKDLLNALPPEIIERILRFLSKEDLLTLRRVCHNLKRTASGPRFLKLDFSVFRTQKDLNSDFIKPFMSNIVSMTVTRINRKRDRCESDDDHWKRALENDDVPGRILRKLDQEYPNLRNFGINWTTVPIGETMAAHENLVRRLTSFSLLNCTLKSGNFLSATYPKLTELEIRATSFEDDGPTAVRMASLRKLHLKDMEEFGDEQFHRLTAGNLDNLRELSLTCLKMTGKDLTEKSDMPNLTDLEVCMCHFDAESLSQLQRLRRLQRLSMSHMRMSDERSLQSAFRNCTELQVLEFDSIDFGNRTVSAMASHLPNLRRWILRCSSDDITDEAFNDLTTHVHLTHIVFERVHLTDTSLRRIASLTPNLTELTLSDCSAGDEAIALIGRLQFLTRLRLYGSVVTDAGFAALEPRMGDLVDLTIDSENAITTSLHRAIPLLRSVRNLEVQFGASTHSSGLLYHRHDARQGHHPNDIEIRNLPSQLVSCALRQFTGVDHIDLQDVVVDEQVIGGLRQGHTCLKQLAMTQCTVTDDLVSSLAAALTAAETIMLHRSRWNDVAIVRYVGDVLSHGRLRRVEIENQPFPSRQAIVALMHMTSLLNYIEVRTIRRKCRIVVNNDTEVVEIRVSGRCKETGDSVVVKIAKRHPDARILDLKNTLVTVRGLSRIGSVLTRLTDVKLKSSTLGDDAAVIIGQDFPCLTKLDLQCKLLTDAGLEALGKQMTTVKKLAINGSDITDDGVRRLVSKLTSIAHLSLSENRKLTKETYDYLTATYPNLQLDSFP